MKKYIDFLKNYFSSYYNTKLYISTALFLVLLIGLEVKCDFRDVFISPLHGSYIQLPWYFMLQGVPYFVTCWLVYRFTDCKSFITSRSFWLQGVIVFLILAHYRAFYFDATLTEELPWEIKRYVYKCTSKLFDVILIVLPSLLVYLAIDRKYLDHFYGLRIKGVSWKVYGYVMLGMTILVWIASYQQEFLDYYPTYKRVAGEQFAHYMNLPEGIVFTLYEFCYAMKFISVELFFRGLLVFTMLRFMKGYAILPMAVTYCVLHFGKPYGETISSIFGGYILGIFAYYSKNIYGGIAVHMGIAILMDIAAYIQLEILGRQ